jgi:hypothetical protein
MYGNDRAALREVFLRAWRKHRAGEAPEGVEALILEVAQRHPEYHPLLDAGEGALAADWPAHRGEANPFLHMGLHIALAEQLAADRPPGVRDAFLRLRARHPDAHAAEHAAMECLEAMLWRAQRAGGEPDAQAYLACLRERARRP